MLHQEPHQSQGHFKATFNYAALVLCSHSPALCTGVGKAMSFTVKIKPHKPAVSTLSSLYSSSLLSLSGFLIAFTFLFPLKFPKLFPPGYQKASWVPALRTDCLFPLKVWGVLALTSSAQDQVLPRAVWELSKTLKIKSCVTAWTGNPVSRMEETWKCYRK